MAYKPFKSRILSEWRLYINNNEIIDSRNYSGDFKINPNYSLAESKILLNKASTQAKINVFPCAYTMDVAILESCENFIVEYNDMWAIGNYGMPNDLYLQLLKERYFEIVKK
ncbi:MAG: ATP-grasp domain-containing protein [Micavibrio sp.]|nr:ATP-grasp domain-containing protein [Micavibrio sp.]